MPKLLVNQPSGKQEIIEISQTGDYFDQNRVLWDERTDGTLPGNVEAGKMTLENGQLVLNANPLQEHADAVYNETIPQHVTIRQAELALREAGYLAAVKTWVEGLNGDLQSYWLRSPTIHRGHAFVESARVELGITQQQMDNLFILAATKEP